MRVSNPDTRRKYIGSAGIKNNLLPVSGQIGYKPHPAQVRGCLHLQAVTCNTIQTVFFSHNTKDVTSLDRKLICLTSVLQKLIKASSTNNFFRIQHLYYGLSQYCLSTPPRDKLSLEVSISEKLVTFVINHSSSKTALCP